MYFIHIMTFKPFKILCSRYDCSTCLTEKKIDFKWFSNLLKYKQRAGIGHRKYWLHTVFLTIHPQSCFPGWREWSETLLCVMKLLSWEQGWNRWDGKHFCSFSSRDCSAGWDDKIFEEIVLITVSLPLLCHSPSLFYSVILAIRPYSIFFQPGQKWKWNITGHIASILFSIKYNLKV